jgi:hypothetical protein
MPGVAWSPPGVAASGTIAGVDSSATPQVAALAAGGLVAGLALLVRGFGGYRTAGRIGGISSSEIAAIAVGEVRVSGVVEPAEVLLVSALQSEPCVYYRASIREGGERDDDRAVLDEERAIGFRVRDGSGDLRVFPRGARWDVPDRFRDRSSLLDGEPAALRLRTGSIYAAAEPDRDARIAELLEPAPRSLDGLPGLVRAPGGDRHYAEARIEPGDTVTIVGRALPFGALDAPADADLAGGSGVALDDPEVAASIARAREAGVLLDDPREAWGNAAIPGFGIGRPAREPELDPEADPQPVAADGAARAARTFDIAPGQLVLAASDEAPLLIAVGAPGAAAGRHYDKFIVGLFGALLAIGSAMVFALAIGGTLG